MLDFIKEHESSWDKMVAEKRPLYVYGTGNGFDRIYSVMQNYGIKVSGVFVSDERYKPNKKFIGFETVPMSEFVSTVDDCAVVLAFGTELPDVIATIYDISERYRLYVPDVPVFGSGLFNYKFCLENSVKIQKAYNLFKDDFSKKVYADIINFKISGDIKYLKEITSSKDDIYKILNLSDNEVFYDLGAYNGDTVEEFILQTKGKYDSIVAMEPDSKNFAKLTKTVENLGAHNIELLKYAAWSLETEIPFSSKAGRQSAFDTNSKTTAPAKSVDNIYSDDDPYPTYIKIDVEGADKEALWGASETIAKYSPKIAVSLYHCNEDIFEIPLSIDSINQSYNFYIRHLPYIPAWETNLYAIKN
ncbi:MAG: FkbM family methyltransferase [Ruminococcus sp.]|nr:FkbM family methyltransferase [Ruminococcus sp.]